jgi:thymidylate kinase
MNRHTIERPHRTRPVRVVVEGLCLAGKSTLTTALAPALQAVVIPEYADLAPLPGWPPADETAARKALAHFARLEDHRQSLARRTSAPAVVFDRCPLTLVAHEAGMQTLGIPAVPEFTAAQLSRWPLPDLVVYVSVGAEETATRMRRRGPLPAHLVHPTVRAALARYYAAALDELPTERVLHLDGTRPVAHLTEEVTAHLAALPACPPGHWRLPVPGAQR